MSEKPSVVQFFLIVILVLVTVVGTGAITFYLIPNNFNLGELSGFYYLIFCAPSIPIIVGLFVAYLAVKRL